MHELTKSFYEAIISVSYISDPELRDEAVREIIEAHKAARSYAEASAVIDREMPKAAGFRRDAH